ncbi:Phosphoglucosamine mutase [Ferriphaselus amnicola]|uniref:Phosphoglucosamine mutase n=1 Tax=Ferriphaselus amnicola TaxID=1188319 RepID=A0A2Z6GD46_9PROT|nr:phosphomannomutase [Ferriphaselus amnicola]BBE51456.1 Phosphoglucosamine mutase [Ferriphaselus amnicola]
MTTINIQQMMADSGVAFGTSGARGLVSQMSGEVCAAYTLAFLQGLGSACSGQRIALGIDLRPSSPAIARACAAAIREAGCVVDYCGVLPTPALALHSLALGIPAIMVTGSHIPFDRNGIKFYTAQGEISKADEAAIAGATVEVGELAGDLPAVNPVALDQFRLRYTELFSADLLKGWRVGVYEHSSAARDVLKQILSDLGAEVLGLERTDTFVPIDTEAVGEEDRQRGRTWAAQHKLDAIISTDGDGDRPLIGDETGDWLRGDVVGLLCSHFLGADTVVTPVSCNTAIEASGWFKQVIRTRIGSPYVIAGMEQASGGVAGFEANGGFLAGNNLVVNGHPLAALPTRDSILPALALLAMARQQGCKMSELLNGLPQRFTASDRLQNFAVADSRALLERLQASEDAYRSLWGDALGAVVKRDTTDGLRLTFANGEIAHLRPSGNAPELRCYAEADSVERAQVLVNETLAKIAQG